MPRVDRQPIATWIDHVLELPSDARWLLLEDGGEKSEEHDVEARSTCGVACCLANGASAPRAAASYGCANCASRRWPIAHWPSSLRKSKSSSGRQSRSRRISSLCPRWSSSPAQPDCWCGARGV